MFFNTTVSSGFTRTAAAVFVAGAMALTASFAHASTPDADVKSVEVSYADLNLSTDQGAQALHQRIVYAARQVCPIYSNRDTTQLARNRQCVADAVARAMNDVGPKLAAVRSAQVR